MITKVISGGQTGVDVGGLRAAKAEGVATGGWMPKGWLTDEGPRPEYADLYGMREHESDKYPPRTSANVRDSDGTLIFRYDDSPGTRLTIRECNRQQKHLFVVQLDWNGLRFQSVDTPAAVTDWVREHDIKILNVAGPRERNAFGVCLFVERFVSCVIR